MTVRHERLMIGLALTACALTLLVEALGAGTAFAYAAPVLLLLLPLLGGRYVGAERLERMTLARRADAAGAFPRLRPRHDRPECRAAASRRPPDRLLARRAPAAARPRPLEHLSTH